MNIMIFTDNLYMYNSFKRIVKKYNLDKTHIFSYACSSQNKFFNSLDNVEKINININIDKIIETYDLIISCHSKQIFPKKLVNATRCINIHPGLNPYNRGWFPQVFSILNKKKLGATIHEMDEEIDHGKIIVQEEVELYQYDTSLSAYNRVVEKEVKLLEENIQSIINNEYNAIEMAEDGNYNSKQDFNKLCELNLDENCTMKDALDKLRALTHGEYKNAYFLDEQGNKIYVSIEFKR